MGQGLGVAPTPEPSRRRRPAPVPGGARPAPAGGLSRSSARDGLPVPAHLHGRPPWPPTMRPPLSAARADEPVPAGVAANVTVFDWHTEVAVTMSTSPQAQPRVAPVITEIEEHDPETDEPVVAHIVKTEPGESAAAKVAEARIYGYPVEALCGHVWVPSRDPGRDPR